MASSPSLRVVLAVIAGVVPETVLLATLVRAGAVSAWLVVAVAAAGLAVACAVVASLGTAWRQRAERINAVAAALEARRPPTHVVPEDRDAMTRAERRLLDAADAVTDENKSLGDQRDEFEAILRSMTEAVVVTRSQGEVVLLNGAARRMFALDPETDYRGRHFVELCRDPRLQDFVARSTNSAGGQVMSEELTIQIPAQLYLGASTAPVRTTQDAARVLVFHDITQLKSYETVRSDFISNLTHELRTPLSALYGYAETLMQGVEDLETQRRFLNIIARQARRLARLLDDLISLSDLERGISPLNLENLDAAHVVGEAVELMLEQARREGIHLEGQCPADLPKILGDHDRLHQVMVNLLDNAIKYTPRDGHVRASAQMMTGNGGSANAAVSLVVADTGEGIPERDIARLTERFYRVDRARSREMGGTGLGLAIVKHIVQLHHGTLKIESRLGVGTTVTVSIPAAT